MLTDYILLDWSFDQWVIAFDERGVDRYEVTKLWARAYREEMALRLGGAPTQGQSDAMSKFFECQEGWWNRHVFAPGKNPVVIPDAYRTRPRC